MLLFAQARLLLVFVITVHDLPTVVHYTPVPLTVPGRCTPARDIIHIARYDVVPTLRRDFQNFRWNLPLHSVLCNVNWRSLPLVKNLERQWQSWWCLTRRYVIPVTSQVPIFFGFSTWCKSLSRDIGFKCRLDQYRHPRASNMRRKRAKFFPPLWEKKHFY